jgi:hypothetical protein
MIGIRGEVGFAAVRKVAVAVAKSRATIVLKGAANARKGLCVGVDPVPAIAAIAAVLSVVVDVSFTYLGIGAQVAVAPRRRTTVGTSAGIADGFAVCKNDWA